MKLFPPLLQHRRVHRQLTLMSLILMALLLSIHVSAQTFTYEYKGTTLTYNITENNTAEVTTQDNVSGYVTIPEEVVYNDVTYPVTSMIRRAFSGCRSLESITIPNSITEIFQETFSNCSSLKSVTLPNTLTSIGLSVFYGCTSLTTINIPNSVTSIRSSAFSGSSLISINIPNSAITISGNEFSGCSSLQFFSVDPDNPYYSSVDGVLFDKNLNKIIKYPEGKPGSSYSIPETVTSIGSSVFSGCIFLESVSIPNSVVTIKPSKYNSIKNISVAPDNLYYTSVDGVLFDKNQNTIVRYPVEKSGSSYSIPNSVNSIGESAFERCSSLESISIPNTVTSIGNNAFEYCTSLASVDIPESVTSIGHSAFFGCSTLKAITIPNSITSLEANVFRFCTALESVTIPNSVTSIGYYAFLNCTSLESITIPESVTSIISNAFDFCTSLRLFKILSNEILNFSTEDQIVLAVPADKVSEYQVAYPYNKVIPIDEVGFEPESYELALKPGEKTNLSLSVDAFDNVIGFQIDLTLPEGLSLAEENGTLAVSFGEGTTTASHSLSTSKIAGDNSYRIVAYSSKNEPLASGQDLLNFEIVANENFRGGIINISNVIISTIDNDGYQGINLEINAKVNYTFSIGDDITIEEVETLQLAPETDPAIEYLSLDWSSSNPNVAYVDNENILHALTPGEVVITASNSTYGISASINVTVTPILMGDSNDNGIVSIDDVVTDVFYILEKDPQPFSFRKADMNRDSKINIIDVSKTVAIILSNEQQTRAFNTQLYNIAEPAASLNADNIRLDEDGRAVMTLQLNGDTDITALQGDIKLPDGVSISNIKMSGAQTGDHQISFAKLKSGATRFAIYSMSLAGVTSNSTLIEVELEGENRFVDGEVSVGDIYVSDTDCNLLKMGDLSVGVSGASAVSEIATDTDTPAAVYNMQGVLLLRNASNEDLTRLAPGIYIINGKKVQIH